jgi:hypothetical protein
MMKRLLVVIAIVLLVAMGSYAVFAQPRQAQPGQPPMGGGMGRGMMQGPMGQDGMMMMCPMCAAIGGAMMQKSLVQVEDGVIVAVGNRLIKYDNNLNKVRETTIDIDTAGMQQAMQQMMQHCPMHQQMMQRQQGAAPQQPGAQDDHQQHHL